MGQRVWPSFPSRNRWGAFQNGGKGQMGCRRTLPVAASGSARACPLSLAVKCEGTRPSSGRPNCMPSPAWLCLPPLSHRLLPTPSPSLLPHPLVPSLISLSTLPSGPDLPLARAPPSPSPNTHRPSAPDIFPSPVPDPMDPGSSVGVGLNIKKQEDMDGADSKGQKLDQKPVVRTLNRVPRKSPFCTLCRQASDRIHRNDSRCMCESRGGRS